MKYEPRSGIVIGEIACGHEGKLKRLFDLIDVTHDGGAQIVKFQIYKIEERALPNTKEWSLFSEWVLNDDEWKQAVEYARNKDLMIFADVYGQESLVLADKLQVDGYKIHSEDVLNSHFILDVLRRDKTTLISVGGAKRVEINNLMNFLSNNHSLSKVILMTGVQTFPTPIDGHSIEEVSDLIKKYSDFGVKVGFSDHIQGDLDISKILPFMAWSRGACLVEKHLTLDRNQKWIDYHSSLGREDFIDFMNKVRNLCPLLEPIKEMNEHEYSYRKMFKKSPTFTTNLNEGDVIDKSHIVFKKDSNQSLIPTYNLVGKRLLTSVQKGQVCKSNLVQNKVGAIIVARCSSSRLPNKALKKINGVESIKILIDRIKKCNNVDNIVLSTSTHTSDDKLVELAKREGIDYYRGSLEKVAKRYYDTANAYGFDHFVRITGDAICSDYEMIDKIIDSHLESGCDVTFMKNMPFGTHNQVVSINTIKTIIQHAVTPENTEYLEYYLENDRYFNINYLDSEYDYDIRTRITLDYQEDYNFLSEIYSRFDTTEKFKNILDYINENPKLIEINTHKIQKTPSNQNLNVSLNI
jgi:N,N'-diacetyllegionaminate synthase